MFAVKLKDGTSYVATHVEESYRKGVYSLMVNLVANDSKALDTYAKEWQTAADEITITDDANTKSKIFGGYGDPVVSRNFAEDHIIVRVSKE